MMAIEQARGNIGNGVIYRPPGGRAEDGVITAVSDTMAFVLYA